MYPRVLIAGLTAPLAPLPLQATGSRSINPGQTVLAFDPEPAADLGKAVAHAGRLARGKADVARQQLIRLFIKGSARQKNGGDRREASALCSAGYSARYPDDREEFFSGHDQITTCHSRNLIFAGTGYGALMSGPCAAIRVATP